MTGLFLESRLDSPISATQGNAPIAVLNAIAAAVVTVVTASIGNHSNRDTPNRISHRQYQIFVNATEQRVAIRILLLKSDSGAIGPDFRIHQVFASALNPPHVNPSVAITL